MHMPADHIRFIRVGTPDNPSLLPSDVHISTTTKQDWVILPPEDQVDEEFYDSETTWSPESKERRGVVQEAAVLESS